MAINTQSQPVSRCRQCGYTAPSGDDAWNEVSAPPFHRMTQCPDCGSTDVLTGR